MRVRPTPARFDRSGATRRRSVAAIVLVAAGGLLGLPAVASASALPAAPAIASASAPASGVGGPFFVAPAALSVSAAPSVPAAPPVPSSLAASLRTSRATVKKTSCAGLSRKAKRAKGSERKRLNSQVKRCKDGNEAATRALKAIGNGRYVGMRGDGQTVDWTYCANGKYTTRTSGRDGTGVSSGSSWRVGAAERNGSKGFTAIVEDPTRRSSVGLVLRGGKWAVGVSRSDNSVESIGNVQRTDATAECAAL